ncbi:MAG: hypothetical protein QJR02_10420 [Sinobacteraceae bacterium]|nr:hypothetical protein [Nevskiaceae bacterium]
MAAIIIAARLHPGPRRAPEWGWFASEDAQTTEHRQQKRLGVWGAEPKNDGARLTFSFSEQRFFSSPVPSSWQRSSLSSSSQQA